MGRRRKKVVKKTYGISVEPEIWEQLEKDGVNKSRLFSIFARKYLRKKANKRRKMEK